LPHSCCANWNSSKSFCRHFWVTLFDSPSYIIKTLHHQSNHLSSIFKKLNSFKFFYLFYFFTDFILLQLDLQELQAFCIVVLGWTIGDFTKNWLITYDAFVILVLSEYTTNFNNFNLSNLFFNPIASILIITIGVEWEKTIQFFTGLELWTLFLFASLETVINYYGADYTYSLCPWIKSYWKFSTSHWFWREFHGVDTINPHHRNALPELVGFLADSKYCGTVCFFILYLILEIALPQFLLLKKSTIIWKDRLSTDSPLSLIKL